MGSSVRDAEHVFAEPGKYLWYLPKSRAPQTLLQQGPKTRTNPMLDCKHQPCMKQSENIGNRNGIRDTKQHRGICADVTLFSACLHTIIGRVHLLSAQQSRHEQGLSPPELPQPRSGSQGQANGRCQCSGESARSLQGCKLL